MKKLQAALLAAAAAFSMSASALDMGQSLRVGAMGGFYKLDKFRIEGLGVDEEGDAELAYGVTGGYGIGTGDFYGDVALEFLRSDDASGESFDRTDLLLTGGFYLNDTVSLFGGWRQGWQGDGPFDDEIWKESGPYVGGGLGGMQMGAGWALNTALAYNFSEIEFSDGSKFDYPGVSLKVGVIKSGSPHAFQFRVQRFSGEENISGFDVELTEMYAVFTYLYLLSL